MILYRSIAISAETKRYAQPTCGGARSAYVLKMVEIGGREPGKLSMNTPPVSVAPWPLTGSWVVSELYVRT